jgi:osmotically-inducible protein OsmY
LAGLLISEMFGNVDSERVRRAVSRVRDTSSEPEPIDPHLLEHGVEQALHENPTTGSLPIRARALGDGIVELTGTAPDQQARSLAGDLARGVEGARVVVNRVLVGGTDVPRESDNPQSAG